MSSEAMKLAAEFNRYFTSGNGVDVPAKVSVSRDEWRALLTAIQQAEAQQPATGEPEFSRIAKRKLDELQKQGFGITGYAIQRGTQRGFITNGGFVGWWRSDEAPSVPDDVVRDAISTVREHYRGTDWGKAAESICDAIDAMLAAK